MRTRRSFLRALAVVLAVVLATWLALPAPATAAPAPEAERAARGGGDAGDDLDEIAALRDQLVLTGNDAAVGGPAIAAVLSAAYAAAGLDRDPGGGWIRRARLGGLVPWLTVRTTRDTSWQDDQPEVGHGTTFEVRATWRLDRLVF
ncbi:MAG TPA: hypothetical protein VFT22_38790, partial [Kofleriaceae bacterium]|nr:hypothetical protein [Kofleriaceae bacterium]